MSKKTSKKAPEADESGAAFPSQAIVLPCDEPIIFPHLIAPVVVSDEGLRAAVDEALRGERVLALFPTLPLAEDEEPEMPESSHSGETQRRRLHPVGTLCAVIRMLKIPDGTIRLLVHGVSRVAIGDVVSSDPHLVAKLMRVEEPEEKSVEIEALMKQVIEKLQRAIQLTNLPEDLGVAALNVEEPGKLADLVASNLNLKRDVLLEVLAEIHPVTRLEKVFGILNRELAVMEIGSNIGERVREAVDKNQRDFFLREQIKALQSELGERDPHEMEMDELRERLAAKQLPEHAAKVAEKELGRLQMLQPAAAEYSVIRTYLDWILDLPWAEKTDDHIDILKAAGILDEDHYGLEKVKERILEFLAVIRLKGGAMKGPILCLVGPPGVGKTSLGRSIARATGRKFARFSVGGIRDEAEIRGHRRTYIGAMPGRVIKSLKDCGSINPLIMLDEIDKLGMDFRGDPASALLEVLDPEQNDTFTDHYMDMPCDLSQVMFITTANSLDPIPGPLRDRMEIIRIAGYTPEEKLEIARRFLVPQEIANAGLRKKDIRFHKAGLEAVIRDYTSEAGVRTLQKRIGAVCRKAARRFAEQESRAEAEAPNGKSPKGRPAKTPDREPVVLTQENASEFLGNEKNFSEAAERMGRPGVCIGLAWTPVGGDILFLEANRYPGKGHLRLTGQLGDVMKESGAAALSWLRANRDLLGVDDEVFASSDFHLHVPAGATPKDGPSAGTAMAATLASLVTGRPVKDFLAMTGEITLRGAVLPVGGIKEKCLAASRAGIKTILLPEKNGRDLADLPETVRKRVDFILVSRVEEVLDAALQPK